MKPIAARARVSQPQPRYIAAQWPDPEDTNPLRREARQVKGLTTYSVIRALHKRTPGDITAAMVAAADRLACDVEEAGTGFPLVAAYGEGGARAGVWGGKPADRAIDAVGRVRAAERALAGVGDVIAWVVVGNRPVKVWAADRGCSETVAKGFLMAALSLLAAHYETLDTNPIHTVASRHHGKVARSATRP